MFIVTYYDRQGAKHIEEHIGTPEEIAQRLEHEGFRVVSINRPRVLLYRKVKRVEVAAALLSVSDLLKGGVALSRALDAAILSTDKSSRLRGVLSTISQAVAGGKSLSKAMEGYRDLFGSTVISMIASGEVSGKLAETLATAAAYMQRMDETSREFRKKLVAPASVFLLGLVSLAFNTYFVIPRLLNSPLFASVLEGESSVWLDAMRALAYVMPFLFLLVGAAVGVAIWAFKSQNIEVGYALMRLPLLRQLLFYREFYAGFFSLAKLLDTGVRLDVALSIVAKGSSVGIVQAEFNKALVAVRAGESFCAGLTFLRPVEKTLLQSAQTVERVKENVDLVAKRFFIGYMDAVRGLGPKITIITMLFTAGIFLLMLGGIMVPYSKLIGGLGG